MKTLYIRDGQSYQPATPALVLESAQRLIYRKFRAKTRVLKDPDGVREFVLLQLGPREHEVFAAIFLDNRHRLIEYVELFRGSVDTSSVHAREVVKEALARNASAVVFVHNHPSGDATPSQADVLVTRRLKSALALVDIQVLDHLIVGDSIVSFAERALLL